MRKLFAFISAIFLCIGLIMLPCEPVCAAEQTRYGYSLLTSDVQRTLYQEILSCVEALIPEITLSIRATENSLNLIKNEIQYVIQMVTKDCPELFWFRGVYGYSASGTVDDIKIVVKPEYVLNGHAVSAGSSELTMAMSHMDEAVSKALATIPQNASDYEIALALHDYLADHVTYLKVGDHQTAYGALVSGKAVCAGYARAYQFLLNRAGIPCGYIEGESYDSNNTLVKHAWNLVWLDGKCYYTDVTWDDQGDSNTFHEYFNLSKEEISKTHFHGSYEKLPESCGHDSYRFFIKNSGKGICDIRDHKEDTDVANCFQLKSVDGNYAVYYCTIHFHQDGFWSWYFDHLESIGFMLGFESFSGEVINLGHEYHVLLEGVLSEVPTEPSVTPTETVSTKPVETTQQIQPTQQTAKPTESQTQPSEQPTQSNTRPPQQNTRPTQPSGQPTQPSTQPTQPSVQSTQPVFPVTQPSEQPTQPTVQTIQPNAQPINPTSQLTYPTVEITYPSIQDTQPKDHPTQPMEYPTLPSFEQNQHNNPQNQPSESATQATDWHPSEIPDVPTETISNINPSNPSKPTNPTIPSNPPDPNNSTKPVASTSSPEESQIIADPAASQERTEPCSSSSVSESINTTDNQNSAKPDDGSKVVTVIVSVLLVSGIASGTVFYFVNRKRRP